MPDSPRRQLHGATARLEAGAAALLSLASSYLEGEEESPEEAIEELAAAASWLQEHLSSEATASRTRLTLVDDPAGLRFIDVYDGEAAFLRAASDDEEVTLDDGFLAVRADGDAFDALPLAERLTRLVLDEDDRICTLARLVARGPGYAPMDVDATEEDELPAMAAATTIAAAVMAAHHVVSFTHDDEREIVLEGRIRRLVDLAARALGVLDAEDRSLLRDPWTPQGRFLRSALVATDLDAPAVHRAAHLVAPALYAGVTGGEIELGLEDEDEDEDEEGVGAETGAVLDAPDAPADDAELRDEERALVACIEEARASLDERDAAVRTDTFRVDPPALAFALGVAWRRYADGPDWVAPWTAEWPEQDPRDDRDAGRRA